MRIDQLAVVRGLAPSRSAASRLIDEQSLRWRAADSDGDWRTPRKAGEVVPDDCQIESSDSQAAQYVSRGGRKLAGALAHTQWCPAGQWCVDVGQGTGGFTDCLLQQGAAGVLGIDVGREQLHPRFKTHDQVVGVEGFNARDHQPDVLLAAMQAHHNAAWHDKPVDGFDALVGDVSFISQVKVWPGMLPLLKPGAAVLMLVKPQFELQPADIGKGGLVKHARSYALVEQQLKAGAAEQGLEWLDFFESTITGGDGNREFFMWARKAA